jgi:hypothetical protein
MNLRNGQANLMQRTVRTISHGAEGGENVDDLLKSIDDASTPQCRVHSPNNASGNRNAASQASRLTVTQQVTTALTNAVDKDKQRLQKIQITQSTMMLIQRDLDKLESVLTSHSLTKNSKKRMRKQYIEKKAHLKYHKIELYSLMHNGKPMPDADDSSEAGSFLDDDDASAVGGL